MRSLFKRKFWSRRKILILVLVIAGLVVYANTFVNQMFWDDEDFVLNNVYVQEFAVDKFFTANLIEGAGLVSNYWRPALATVFSLQYQLWGNTPYGYHVVSTIFHIAAAVILFQVLLSLFRNKWLAFFTSLIFLIHPLQTEAVSYVSSLGDSLSVFFIFLGLLLYLKDRKNWALLIYVLALLSKETAVIMPALVFLVEWYRSNWKRALKYSWPFFAVALIYIVLRGTTLNFKNTFNLYDEANIFTGSVFVRILTFFRILVVYFGLLFLPVGLHMERSVDFATGFAGDVLFGGIIFVGLIALAIYSYKRFKIVSFGILWFFIGLSVTSNVIVPINGLLYEHWLYLPLVGIFLIVVWLGQQFIKKFGGQKVVLALLVISLCAFGVLSIRRNRVWRDPITFYNQTLEYAPESYRIINNLAKAYAEIGDYENAETTYVRAIEVSPESPVAYHNLGNTYRETGRLEEAVENYKKAIELDADFIFSVNALASLYLENNQHREARELLETRLDGTDNRVSILTLLAQAALNQGDFESALQYLKEALEIDPGNANLQRSYIEVKIRLE